MPINFNGDGSNRAPRKVQIDALQWVKDNWDMHKFLVMQMPVGSGKSYVARTIQRASNAAVITPSNLLVEQYMKDYPTVNHLIGRKHYQCHTIKGLDCETVKEVGVADSNNYCNGCTYVCNKDKARKGAATFFNPMSLLYFLMAGTESPYTTLIVDEAHSLVSMLNTLAGKTFWSNETDLPLDIDNELKALKWFDSILPKLKLTQRQYTEVIAKNTDPKERKALATRLEEIDDTLRQIHFIRQGLIENPELYAFWYGERVNRGKKDTCLNIRPIMIPEHVTRTLFNKFEHVVFMSGTMFKTDIENLLKGQAYAFKDFPSPIDKDRRSIIFRPVAYSVNNDTNPKLLAEDIMRLVTTTQGPHLIHCTYSWGLRLKQWLPDNVLTNTTETKMQVLAKFKKQGGIWLASGCAEGVDLPGDLCRTNIIPALSFPNLMDEVVKKRKGLQDGQYWYDLEAIKTTIQQAGRSTRREDDYSETYILAPSFKRVYKMYKHLLPKSFTEAVKGVV